MERDPELESQIEKLKKKYDVMGQDIHAYLDGLLCSNCLTYWDYIHLDTLLTLQNPKTDFPDEEIFVMYHQITELYFKLALHELHQIAHNGKIIAPNGNDMGWNEKLDPGFLALRLARINGYFEALTKSFDIMTDGMEKAQFLRFRMALLPASGFQSAQYRKIEIAATEFIQLVDKEVREGFRGKNLPIEELYKHIYWKKGATELETGKKTLTLRQFEDKYGEALIDMANEYADKNVWAKYSAFSQAEKDHPGLRYQLRQLDVNVNVNWPLVHYRTAARYLAKDREDISATGGTNWQDYLPPRFQRRIFYPSLWTDEEIANWGKGWVEKEVLRNKEG